MTAPLHSILHTCSQCCGKTKMLGTFTHVNKPVITLCCSVQCLQINTLPLSHISLSPCTTAESCFASLVLHAHPVLVFDLFWCS